MQQAGKEHKRKWRGGIRKGPLVRTWVAQLEGFTAYFTSRGLWCVPQQSPSPWPVSAVGLQRELRVVGYPLLQKVWWVWSCHSFLPEGGVMLHLFIEIHACSSLQEPWKTEEPSFFSLRQQCTWTSKALPCLVHVREHLLMHWDRRSGRSHHHLPALSLCYLPIGKGQPLLATLEAILWLLTRKYCSCIQWQRWSCVQTALLQKGNSIIYCSGLFAGKYLLRNFLLWVKVLENVSLISVIWIKVCWYMLLWISQDLRKTKWNF